jgi:hypothetical protein
MSLCTDQDKFNDAFYKALKNARKKDEKNSTGVVVVYAIIHMVFLIWGVMLAFHQPREQRIMHITLAAVFSPVYVLAYYLNMF